MPYRSEGKITEQTLLANEFKIFILFFYNTILGRICLVKLNKHHPG